MTQNMSNGSETPAQLGYRWPAEWEPHEGTWLSWPHRRATWPGDFDAVPPRFAEFARALAKFEPVHILAGGTAVLAEAQRLVGAVPGVTLHDIPTDDAWCRDHGPTFLAGPSPLPPALVDWQFNSWGGKYLPFERDNDVPRRVAELLHYRRFEPGLVLEGGSIEGNGLGTLLTTTSCLLNPNRNPGRSRLEVEQRLSDYLGARKILWLEGAELAGDDTDGHVDQLARFVDSRTVVVAWEDDPSDINFPPLRRIFDQLQQMTDQDGQPLRIVPLRQPEPKFHLGRANERLPASYCNFCFVNGGVIVPTFDDPRDAEALATLERLIPDRQIVGVRALELVWGLGACHCLSQQQVTPCPPITSKPARR